MTLMASLSASRLAATALFTLIGMLMTSHSHAQTKQILDLKVDAFQTGLQEAGYGAYWVDANQYVVTTLQDGETAETLEQDRLTRLAIINVEKKTIKFVAQGDKIFQYDRETRVLLVGRTHSTPSWRVEVSDLREIRIQPDGEVEEVRRFEPGVKPKNYKANYPNEGILMLVDNGKNGYIFQDLAPGDTRQKQQERDWKEDEGYPTTWVRPGKPPMPLSVRYDEINTVIYVDFLDKYLLNLGGTGNSNVYTSKVWKRPYDYVPIHLLSQDGTIEEIPYPTYLFDYGVINSDPKRRVGQDFGYFLITRAGQVIYKSSLNGSSLYLYKDNQLYRIAGGKVFMWMLFARLSAEGVEGMQLSPDGCKIAYTHFNIGADSAKGYSPRYITIINVCKG